MTSEDVTLLPEPWLANGQDLSTFLLLQNPLERIKQFFYPLPILKGLSYHDFRKGTNVKINNDEYETNICSEKRITSFLW
jgi:hypothetical protein